jgi:uncharacterized RDD family membrane protein YckC
MNWYYVEDGRQIGPVADEQLPLLFQTGKIYDDTLVWHEGMADWTAYRQVRPASSPLPPGAPPLPSPQSFPGAGEVRCAECGKTFPAGDTIQYGTVNICAGCKPVFLQRLAEGGRLNTGELNYASVPSRFVAILLDGVILFAVNFVIGLAAGLTAAQAVGARPTAAIAFQMILLAINLSIAITYESVLIGKYGATLGKMACKIKVVTADGGKVSYARAFGRHFAKMLSSFTCLIGYVIAIFDAQKRALHDHICNTRVVTNER